MRLGKEGRYHCGMPVSELHCSTGADNCKHDGSYSRGACWLGDTGIKIDLREAFREGQKCHGQLAPIYDLMRSLRIAISSLLYPKFLSVQCSRRKPAEVSAKAS